MHYVENESGRALDNHQLILPPFQEAVNHIPIRISAHQYRLRPTLSTFQWFTGPWVNRALHSQKTRNHPDKVESCDKRSHSLRIWPQVRSIFLQAIELFDEHPSPSDEFAIAIHYAQSSWYADADQ